MRTVLLRVLLLAGFAIALSGMSSCPGYFTPGETFSLGYEKGARTRREGSYEGDPLDFIIRLNMLDEMKNHPLKYRWIGGFVAGFQGAAPMRGGGATVSDVATVSDGATVSDEE